MASHHPIRKLVPPPAPVIPDKLYFRIGDVARLCQVPAYVLRFWETEFPQLKPNKGGTGQRLYRRKDVEIALRIKALLYDQGYTIPGARQVFKSETPAPETSPSTHLETPAATAPQSIATASTGTPHPIAAPAPHDLHVLREELRKLAAQLAQPVGAAPAPPALAVLPAPPPSKPMRPRLVVESKAEAKITPLAFQTAPLLDPRQRDLFAAE